MNLLQKSICCVALPRHSLRRTQSTSQSASVRRLAAGAFSEDSLAKGFTFVELTLAIVLTGLIGLTLATTFTPVLNAWSLARPRDTVASSLNYAMGRMVGEIAQLKDKNSVTAASSTALTFTDTSNTSIQFRLLNGNLMRNSDVLARNVTALTFSYWNIANQTLATLQVAPAATNIWRIAVKTTGSSKGQTINYESQVRPRNLPRS